jgi:hypothetical protein
MRKRLENQNNRKHQWDYSFIFEKINKFDKSLGSY